MEWTILGAIGGVIVAVLVIYNWIVVKPIQREREQTKEKLNAMEKRIEKVEINTDKMRAELLSRIDKIDEKSEARHKELTSLFFSLAKKQS